MKSKASRQARLMLGVGDVDVRASQTLDHIPFRGRVGESRHAVPHLVKELDRQVTQTSGSQHGHLRRFRQARSQDPCEYGQAGREQRRRRRRVELQREPEGKPTIDDDVIGETAIPVDGDDLLAGAQLLRAQSAVGALEARLLLVADAHAIPVPQVGHVRTRLFDDADDLVARDQGEPRVAPVIVDELDVAPGHAAVRDPHQDLTSAEVPLIEEGFRSAASALDGMSSDSHLRRTPAGGRPGPSAG